MTDKVHHVYFNINSKGKFVPMFAMKEYGQLELHFHSYLTLAQNNLFNPRTRTPQPTLDRSSLDTLGHMTIPCPC